jgi:hypothetical protein
MERYWLPLLEYFSYLPAEYGVLWQILGGTLPIFDPSSLVFDPLMLVLNNVFIFPIGYKIYLITILLLCSFSSAAFMKQLGISDSLCIVGTLAYVLSGISISILSVQFIPIYYVLPVFFYCVYNYFFSSLIKKRYLIASVLSTYYLCYTAVVGISVLCILVLAIFASKIKRQKRLVLLGAFTFPFLIFPYLPLLYAYFSGITPSVDFVGKWSFHPVRLISLVLPEHDVINWSLNWFDHVNGSVGKSEPYFSNINIPPFIVIAWFVLLFKTNRLRGLNKITKYGFVLTIVALLFSMYGLLPISVKYWLRWLPFFSFRYTEKYLIIFIPLFIYTSIFILNNNIETKAIKRGCATFLISVIVLALVYSANFNGFYMQIKSYSLSIWFALIFSLLFFYFSQRGDILKSKKVTDSLMFCSFVAWSIIPLKSIDYYFQKDESRAFAMTNFYAEIQERIRGKFLLVDYDATVGGCLSKNIIETKIQCLDHGFSNMRLALNTFGNLGTSSFVTLKALRQSHHFDDLVVLLKPDFVIIPISKKPKEFCKKLIKKYESVLTCNLSYLERVSHDVALLEISHRNQVQVLSKSTPFDLYLKIKNGYEKIRIPFAYLPKITIYNEDKIIRYEHSDYGLTLDAKSLGETKTIRVHYEPYLLKISVILFLISWLIIIISLLLYLRWSRRTGQILYSD